jgi:hypothetical protein
MSSKLEDEAIFIIYKSNQHIENLSMLRFKLNLYFN